MNELLRLFVALPLNPELTARIGRLQEALRRELTGDVVRWVPAGQVHLTLLFLGDVAADRLPELKTALSGACAGQPTLSLRVEGLGAFPRRGPPRVLWLGLTGEVAGLAGLQGRVEAAAGPFAARPGRKPFHPHLTLGRVRDRDRGAAKAVERTLAGFGFGESWPWEAGEVRLMRSVLDPAGAVHARLAGFPLGGENGDPP